MGPPRRGGRGATLYHCGDGNNLEKMHPDRPLDLFIPHVEVGLPIELAVQTLKPARTFVSHVLELAHSPTPPNAWRWSFAHAYRKADKLPAGTAYVLTWGERWEASGTR